MSLNPLPISARTLPTNQAITANGSYTLPQYAFIPSPGIQPLSAGMVSGPTAPGLSGAFAVPALLASRPYPVPSTPSVYGLRSVQVKASPG